jgi:hypothetical protein
MNQAPVVIQTPSTTNAQRINVVVHISADVLAPDVARKRANGWLLDNVGNLVHAEMPELVAGEKMVWRLQVVLTSPRRGQIGPVGSIDLDAASGTVLADDAVIQRIHTNAAQLAQS